MVSRDPVLHNPHRKAAISTISPANAHIDCPPPSSPPPPLLHLVVIYHYAAVGWAVYDHEHLD